MKLKTQTKQLLARIDGYTTEALEELMNQLLLEWHLPYVKKATEWETLWAVAEREAKKQALIEFMSIIKNPPK